MQRSPRFRHRILRAGLAVALVVPIAVVQVPAAAAAAGENPSEVGSYAPAETINVALSATATAHSAQPDWPPSKLVDNHPGTPDLNLWSAADVGVSLGGWVNLDLVQVEPVQRIVLFPRGDGAFYGAYFPAAYKVSLLDPAGTAVWTHTVTHPNSDRIGSIISAPDVIDVDTPVLAKTVRIDIIERHAREGGVLQIGEVAVFAKSAPNPAIVDTYAPAGATNAARSATVTAHSSQADSPPSNLVDNDTGTAGVNLWSAEDVGQTLGGWVNVELAKAQEVKRVVLFPRGDQYGVYFPAKYTLSLLDANGAAVWSKTVSHPNSSDPDSQVVSAPDVIDVDRSVLAKTARIDVIERHARDGGLLQLSEVAAFGIKPSLAAFGPAGTTNLAPRAYVSYSTSYESPGDTWAAAYVHDGEYGTGRGWSTPPWAEMTDPGADAWLTFDLLCQASIKRLVVFPRQDAFPKDYRLETSTDGTNWTSVATSTGNPAKQSDPQVFDPAPAANGRYVRLFVEERSDVAVGPYGYLVQLSEVAIFGTQNGCLSPVKPALLMAPGSSEEHWFIKIGDPAYTAHSSDHRVATVDPNGKITAVGEGTATITLTHPESTLTVPVEVSDDIERVGDDFLVTIFFPPMKDFVNDEQYSRLADAGIDYLQNTNAFGLTDKATNLEMARLAHKYGMLLGIGDGHTGAVLATASEDQVKAWAQEYTNVPGVGGYYLVDEPGNAVAFANAFKAVREVAPEYYPHLNFFPMFYYGSEEANDRAMQAWLDATGPRGFNDPDYLMYDMYPFREGSTDYNTMFTNLNTVRELGLENRIKTAMYLQSIGITGNLRTPTPTEIRYEANMALAYGYKQLSYFTWWTPTGAHYEPFTEGIIDREGNKTALFDPVKQLNSEIHALGPTLMKLDAMEVYLNGNTYGQDAVPSDFFVQSETSDDLVFSYMRDRDTGRNYMFVVNNSFTAAKDVTLTFDPHILWLEEVSRVDGTLGELVSLTDHKVTRQLAAGEGVLYALPVGYDYDVDRPVSDKAALQARIAQAESECEVCHTPESWAQLAAPLQRARAVAAAADLYQYEVDFAERVLAEALGSLIRHPDWDELKIYGEGDIVVHDGRAYTALWSSQAEVPGLSPWGAWAQIGTPVDVDDSRYPSWTPSWIYSEGDVVAYEGHLWEAKWWSRNQEPGAPNGPWRDRGAY